MNTPIYEFLQQYKSSEFSRYHMPGHKGNHFNKDLKAISSFDITEITGADVLYNADSIINESENNTSRLYETAHTSFSAGGSTLCIQTMLALVLKPKDVIIAARNAHMAFINTCCLLDVMPYWVLPCYNDSFGVSGEITAESIEKAIIDVPNAKAVYITSPDYLGCISDIKAISEVCRKYHKPLLVDNAHGAHLKFTKKDIHPITLGADICCDSPHKTLPVFTGGAYLHVSKNINIKKEQVKSKMSLFGSTSPSYLILTSLDLNNLYLEQNAKDDFLKLEKTVDEIYEIMKSKGLFPVSKHTDITKITLDTYKIGLTGEQLCDYFRSCQIECEYASSRHVVLMISPQNTKEDVERLKRSLRNITPLPLIECNEEPFALPKAILPVREAMFFNQKNISVEEAAGRISGETKIKCPPGVPIVIAGEKIDLNTRKLLKMSGILFLNVIE